MILNQNLGGSRWLTTLFVVLVIAAGIALGVLIPVADGALKVVVLAVGAIGAILTLFNVDIGLYALILMAYLRISDIVIDYHGFPSVFKPFIALLVAAILIRWLRSRRDPEGLGSRDAARAGLRAGCIYFFVVCRRFPHSRQQRL